MRLSAIGIAGLILTVLSILEPEPAKYLLLLPIICMIVLSADLFAESDQYLKLAVIFESRAEGVFCAQFFSKVHAARLPIFSKCIGGSS
jgi:hypothetical protein